LKILVTGGCGYIGSRLVPLLLGEGHSVVVVDTQIFGDGDPAHNDHLEVRKDDVREILKWDDQDVIIHLASISNNEMYSKDIGHAQSVNRWLPSQRIIYASSVAAYGTSGELLTEDSPLKPTTPYGEDKALCEEQVLKNGGTVVRAASVFGPSGNMRFDTPVNRMSRDVLNNGYCQVNGGKQSRCHIHIDDLCDIYRRILKKEAKGVFNAVGFNMPMEALGRNVSDLLDGKVITKPSTDERSYMVSGKKSMQKLKFFPKHSLVEGVIQMKGRFDAGNPQYRDFSAKRVRML
jgi:nucleoside-diphosphate-sugar epimerase